MSNSFYQLAIVANVKPEATTATMPDPSIGSSALKMVLVLAVLGLIAFFIRRRATGRSAGAGSGTRSNRAGRLTNSSPRSNLHVVSRHALGKGAWLAVVEWEGREVLVGITNAGISFYHESDATLLMPSQGENEAHGRSSAPHVGTIVVPSPNERPGVLGRGWSVSLLHPKPDPTVTGLNAAAFSASTANEPAAARASFLSALRDRTVRH